MKLSVRAGAMNGLRIVSNYVAKQNRLSDPHKLNTVLMDEGTVR
jgi:hypothetical protein